MQEKSEKIFFIKFFKKINIDECVSPSTNQPPLFFGFG
jgi:hypothetical protein